MKAYSEDLRRKIVESHRVGYAQGLGRSYIRGRDLHRQALRYQGSEGRVPRTRQGSWETPKMDERVSKLLEEDLKEHPFATLRERCEYVEVISGVSVSRSTMCRAIARIGSTRKKGGESPLSETSS